MSALHTDTIKRMPEYQELLRRRRTLTLPLVILTLLTYYSFILALAFFPETLSIRGGEGVTTIGIWIGLGVIVTTFAITAFYVHAANTHIQGLLIAIQNKCKG